MDARRTLRRAAIAGGLAAAALLFIRGPGRRVPDEAGAADEPLRPQAAPATSSADESTDVDEPRSGRREAAAERERHERELGSRWDELLGFVLDAQGKGVAGARVLVADLGPFAPWPDPDACATAAGRAPSALPQWPLDAALQPELVRELRTDANGAFRLRRPVGWYAVSVRARGFASLEREGVRVPARAPDELLRLTLARGAGLTGSVVDGEGLPVMGARVVRPSARGEAWLAPGTGELLAVTDAQGVFTTDALAAGPARVLVCASGATLVLDGLELVAGEVLELDVVRLPRLAAIAGTVELDGPVLYETLRVQGVPVGALDALRAGASFAWIDGAREGEVDAEGRFALHGLEPGGDYLVRALAHDARFAESDPWARAVLARGGDGDVRLVYRAGAELALLARERGSDRPVRDLELWLARGRSGQLGRGVASLRHTLARREIRLGDVRPADASATVDLAFSAPGFAELLLERVALRPGLATELGYVDIVPAPRLRLAVVDDERGRAVRDAVVLLARRAADGAWLGTRRARSDEHGRVEIACEPAAETLLGVAAPGFAPYVASAPPPQLSDETPAHALRLAPAGSVRLFVEDAHSAPLPAFPVLRSGDPLVPLRGVGELVLTDSDGVAGFDDVGAGRQDLAPPIPAGAYGRAGVYAASEPGRTVDARLVVSPTGELSGHVRANGIPLAGALVSIGAGRLAPRARTDDAGRFALRPLWYDAYTLRAEHPALALPVESFARLERTWQDASIEVVTGDVYGRVVSELGLGLRATDIRVVVAPQDAPARRVVPRGERNWKRALSSLEGMPREVYSHLPSALAAPFAVSNSDGTFRVRGIPVGARVRLLFRRGTRYLGASQPFVVPKGERVELGEITLARAATLRVRTQPEHDAWDGLLALYLDELIGEQTLVYQPLERWRAEALRGLAPGEWALLGCRVGPLGELLAFEPLEKLRLAAGAEE